MMEKILCLIADKTLKARWIENQIEQNSFILLVITLCNQHVVHNDKKFTIEKKNQKTLRNSFLRIFGPRWEKKKKNILRTKL